MFTTSYEPHKSPPGNIEFGFVGHDSGVRFSNMGWEIRVLGRFHVVLRTWPLASAVLSWCVPVVLHLLQAMAWHVIAEPRWRMSYC